ncbi:MAG: Electron transport complex protein RnfE [Verrucomicrobia bacterium ADurb.Bin345]|nr:MAG: Electron transport complex protein RnfE [Verrucomicrobia bacterium ADurb.Bin345]
MSNDGPTPLERFINGILPENPVYRQILGICPTLAVSNTMEGALTMAGAVAFVLICSNILVSLIRGLLKPHLRILVFTLTIAAFVTIADRFLAAYMYDMSKLLGPYIPLIIVNCIIIARCEICASKQRLGAAVMDAVGQSLGFMLGLMSIASVREILGFGTWFGKWLGWRVIPAAAPEIWSNWVIMILPPGAFITLGLLMGVMNWIEARSRKARKAVAA